MAHVRTLTREDKTEFQALVLSHDEEAAASSVYCQREIHYGQLNSGRMAYIELSDTDDTVEMIEKIEEKVRARKNAERNIPWERRQQIQTRLARNLRSGRKNM